MHRSSRPETGIRDLQSPPARLSGIRRCFRTKPFHPVAASTQYSQRKLRPPWNAFPTRFRRGRLAATLGQLPGGRQHILSPFQPTPGSDRSFAELWAVPFIFHRRFLDDAVEKGGHALSRCFGPWPQCPEAFLRKPTGAGEKRSTSMRGPAALWDRTWLFAG